MDNNEQISIDQKSPTTGETTPHAQRRSRSAAKRDSVSTARDRLNTAIRAAEDQLEKIREWVTQHDPANAISPATQAATLTNQLGTRLDKIADAHSSLTKIRQKAATTTLASAVSVIDPNIDLGQIEQLIKSGATGDEIAKALAAKLTESRHD